MAGIEMQSLKWEMNHMYNYSESFWKYLMPFLKGVFGFAVVYRDLMIESLPFRKVCSSWQLESVNIAHVLNSVIAVQRHSIPIKPHRS